MNEKMGMVNKILKSERKEKIFQNQILNVITSQMPGVVVLSWNPSYSSRCRDWKDLSFYPRLSWAKSVSKYLSKQVGCGPSYAGGVGESIMV
jgi:hypothetical protein